MKKATILIVVDEGLDAEPLRAMLLRSGFEVLQPAGGGLEALEQALDLRPDLALIDLKLGGDWDGVETARLMRARLDIPVVYLTDFSAGDLLQAAQQTEPYGYVRKPVQEAELYTNLELALHKHQADRRLRESEEVFRQLAENIHEVVWLSSKDTGRVIYVSPVYETLFGQSCAQLYADSTSFMPLVHPEDRQKLAAAQQALTQQDTPFDIEFRIIRPDGSLRWVRSRSYPIRDAHGRVYRYSGNTFDITLRKLAEQERNRSEASLEEAQRIARLGHWDLDMVENRLRWSEFIYELFNIDPAGFQPSYQAFLDFVHPEDRERVDQAFTDAVEKGLPYEISHRLVMKDGQIRWVNEVGHTEYDAEGKPLRAFGIVQDVTPMKLAEEARRLLEDKFTKAFHTSPDAVSINRMADGLYLDINEGFTALTGYTPEDVLDKTSLDIQIWAHPEDRFRLVRGLLDKGEVKNLECLFRMKNGETRVGLMSARFIEVDGEKCILAVTRDISERKKAEEKLRATSEELQEAYNAVLQSWSSALEIRERETAGHSQRVVSLTLDLAEELGFSLEEQVQIERGALLHDIGKMGIPDRILMKPDSLTEEEWVVMRQHPVHSYKLLSKIPFLAAALDIPYCHHEHWDGHGYPRGLAGEEIPLAARIFSVVDVWDALLSDRPYRSAWTVEEVIQYLVDQSGKQFDPQVVEAFLRLIGTGPLACGRNPAGD